VTERRPGRRALGAVAAAALVGGYLGVAAAAHLVPWEAQPAPSKGHPAAAAAAESTPAEQSTPADQSTPAEQSTPAGQSTPAPAQALWDLIPGAVQAAGCPAVKVSLGAIAVRDCSRVGYGTATADARVTYYLFAGNADLDRAYADFLIAAHVSQGAGNCANFRAYRPPCETGLANREPLMTGRAVEFTHQGFADLVSTDEQRHVLVYLTARDGPAMLKWWVYPARWIVAGGAG
jgi:hypothetical protein